MKEGRKNYLQTPELLNHYKNTFYLKIIGSISFAFVYQFYYEGGDTFCFFFWARAISETIFLKPSAWLDYVFFNDYSSFLQIRGSEWVSNKSGGMYSCYYLFKYNTSDNTFIKIASLFCSLGLNTFLSTSFLFALYSFIGTWKLFLVFNDIFPNNSKIFSKIILYIPSVIFWGTGIMKDTFTFSTLCLITYYIYFGIIKRRDLTKSIFYIFFLSSLVLTIKGYIILSFIPSASYWVFSSYKDKINNSALKIIVAPFFIIVAISFSVLLINNMSSSAGRFSIDNLEKTTKDYQSWHTVASEGGSGYSLGGVTEDFSIGGLLSKFPLAVNVTLFRPYLWEVNNIVMLFSALESFIILYFTLHTFLKIGVLNSFKIISSNSIIIFCLMFSILFAFAVGFTSYNFGALVRYKIPCIPFYLAAIAMVRIKSGKFSSN